MCVCVCVHGEEQRDGWQFRECAWKGAVYLYVYRHPVLDTGQCTDHLITVNDCHLIFLCIMQLAEIVERHNYTVPYRQM